MTKAKLLITRRLPEAVERAMQKHFEVTLNTTSKSLSKEELKQAMLQYDAICSMGTDKLTAEIFSVPGKRVKIVANYGVGYDHIDTAAAESGGVIVSNTPDVLTDATAELAMTLMLMVARRAGEAERQVRENGWKGWYPTHMMGTMVTGKTLGIVGMGRIGLAMAIKAHRGFDMPILYHNRAPSATGEAMGAQYCENLESMLARADFVALHCPSGPETRHIMNSRSLACMQPTAYLINTARGNVVDEAALVSALRDGVIAGAGLDVFEREPEVPEALKKLENVVLLPHIGSATWETREAMGLRVLDNLKAFFSGEPTPDRVA